MSPKVDAASFPLSVSLQCYCWHRCHKGSVSSRNCDIGAVKRQSKNTSTVLISRQVLLVIQREERRCCTFLRSRWSGGNTYRRGEQTLTRRPVRSPSSSLLFYLGFYRSPSSPWMNVNRRVPSEKYPSTMHVLTLTLNRAEVLIIQRKVTCECFTIICHVF